MQKCAGIIESSTWKCYNLIGRISSMFPEVCDMTTITKEMSIGEVLRLDFATSRIFLEFGMHCFGCPHAAAESIEQAGVVHGIDVDALVDALNAHFEAAGAAG